jgi:hypothetical protein
MLGNDGLEIQGRSRHQINPADCRPDDIRNGLSRIPKFACKPVAYWKTIPIHDLFGSFHINNKKARRRSTALDLCRCDEGQPATAAEGTSR